MFLSRRDVLLGGGLAALGAACGGARESMREARGPLTDKKLASVLERALAAAKRAGATYADARIVRRRWETIDTREDHVTGVGFSESYGVGVRVIAGGAWGFAATSRVDEAQAEEAAARAVAIAKADARGNEAPVELAAVPAYVDAWRTPLTRDPFDVSLAEKTELLRALWADARGVAGVKFGDSRVEAIGEWKLFASSEGSLLEQSITRLALGFTATAVDDKHGEFETAREYIALQGGWEHIAGHPITKRARACAENAVEKLKSPSVTPGKRTLVLAPSNLWLTMHESVGHSTELDRALGYEANFAGTSFATRDKLGKLRYAPPHVTIYGDKTTPGGLATCGYDDDGVKTQRWDILKDGVLVAYQTTREQAKWIGESASRGTSYAEDYKSVPFQRMPNVSLAPGKDARSVDDIVSQTDDGVLAIGDASWSIDHQRYNFQFGAQMAYEIKGGKIAHAVRNFAYQSNSLEFWNSCDLIGGEAAWELHGALHDGKGEPGQSNAVSHGCPPARFRDVNILSTKRDA